MKRRLPWLPLLLAALVAAEYSGVQLLSPLEHRAQDALLRADAARRAPAADIVLVQIDERSLAEMAPEFGGFPWPRSTHADLLAGILAQQPRAVVFDLMFSEPSVDHADADQYFIETAAPSPVTYLPYTLIDARAADGLDIDALGTQLGYTRVAPGASAARPRMALPFAALAQTGRIGFINFLADDDGLGRRYALRARAGNWSLPSLPARVARDLGVKLPDADDIVIHWRGRQPRAHISYVDLYRDVTAGHHQRAPDELRGKIVVIGAQAAGLGDLRATPLHSLHPGSDILASAIETLVSGDALRPAPAWLGALLSLAAIALVLALARLPYPLPASGAGAVACALALTAAAWIGLQRNVQLPLFTPAFFGALAFVAQAVMAYLRERAERLQTVQIFSRFVDPNVAQRLALEGSAALNKEPERRVITLLFSDIRGYTTLSEKRAPAEVMALLNRYFTQQVDVVFAAGGTVNKFIGDAIMAIWGAPLDAPDHAQRAVRAALAMSRAVEQFRAGLGAEGAAFDIGIGVHTGEAVVGFLGSRERSLEYTAIGDAVNLASRIEGETKNQHCRILVSEATVQACGAAFDFTERAAFNAKGRTQATRLYEPVREIEGEKS
ncbi:MAG TPA: adenylate/guanylate cyclase domain-containing protein [Nevskiaceae bacterium]|nr:adenylate/guanylate cyclase domain-containing protein [Nevskiaceae bacterium]